ncbi:MAG: hypothetical protein NY202_02365 [Mollicutes bacterium UO1]
MIRTNNFCNCSCCGYLGSNKNPKNDYFFDKRKIEFVVKMRERVIFLECPFLSQRSKGDCFAHILICLES